MTETLPVLLSHALLEFEARYEVEGDVPTLMIWSNILRPLAAGSISVRDFPPAATLTVRTARVALREVERLGLVGRDGKMLGLTAAGEAAMAVGTEIIAKVSASWPQPLWHALREILGQIDVELAHYPVGYGQGDSSFTGGSYVAAQVGPPRIPGHGKEWPVVRRDLACLDGLGLPGLLSQVLIAFTIDYDADAKSVFGGLNTTLSFFRFLPDTGVPLKEVRASGDVTGSGRSNFERHRLVVVEDGVVLPTPYGREVRDAYPSRAFQVESAWRDRFGVDAVDTLRAELEALSISGRADFPDTNGWLRQVRRQKR